MIISRATGGGEYKAIDNGVVIAKASTENELDKLVHEHYMKTNKEYRDMNELHYQEGIRCTSFKPEKFFLVCTSLVGIGGKPPFSFGNYFTVALDSIEKEFPVVNMWAENFRYLKKEGKLDGATFMVFEDAACIIIPKEKLEPEWYIKDAPFLKYNLRKGLSYAQKDMIREAYEQIKKDFL